MHTQAVSPSRPVLAPTTPVLSLRSVTKHFGNRTVLRDVSLELGAGEIVALLGPNGAGKTTALQIALGLRKASSGDARIFGLAPQSRHARAMLGVMPQEVAFPPTLKVSEILGFVASHFPESMPVDEALDRFEMGAIAQRHVGALSVGQRRRLGVACAMIGRARLLVLDEPTIGLDVESRRRAWDLIREVNASGTSILLTTHYIEEAEQLAHRIALIVNGRIVTDKATADVRGLATSRRVRCKVLEPIRYQNRIIAPNNAGYIDAMVENADDFVRTLVATSASFSDLTITAPTLEDAVLTLTRETQ